MTLRVPFLRVTGPSGENMLQTWGSRLIGVRITDRQDDESDECTFMFTRKPPYADIPALGTPFSVSLGWSSTSMAKTGQYSFQRLHVFGEPSTGQQTHYVCRAADLNDASLKQVDSEHFDAENGHKTLGDIFRSVFKKSGQQILVHPEIAQLPVPGGYSLRWRQSAIDYATDLAEQAGAIVKPMDGKILIIKKGSLTSVTGQQLPTIVVTFPANYRFDCEFEPRFEFQAVTGSYLNTDKGTLEEQKSSHAQDGASDALPHPFPSAAAAKVAADAAAAELKSCTANGLFSGPGDPTAVSGAAVKCVGFGPPVDDTQWIADSVTHEVEPGKGWITTIETQAVDGGVTG